MTAQDSRVLHTLLSQLLQRLCKWRPVPIRLYCSHALLNLMHLIMLGLEL
eukprot:CAMPEP_0173112748 /NCGR_PEP_ID=MMETSP1102-20130122/46285_1 /TAXON_ID=49646 /ORGANISM="Geminigera sp., Strain Caron Lab Isolate" /LENGTH=49 /DNA_ID= /DNA_START= /DNA_END= /DNA_ORIENTATION=